MQKKKAWIRLVPFVVFALLWSLSMAEARGPRRYPIKDDRADNIPLGMSTALSGPAAVLGQNMKLGVETAISEVNRRGGIGGRKLRLIALDDGYEPSRTVPNMHRLIRKERVLAVIGNVGTPTAVAAIPIANAGGTPFVGAFSGGGILRKIPPDKYVINFRASYLEEITAMVDSLIEFGKLQPSEIAFFTQRDSYGDTGFSSGIWALKRHGLKDENTIVHSRYERNSLVVEGALADMILATPTPRAVIMVGAYAPCAAFISLAQKNGLDSIFLNVSFVGAEPLAEHLKKEGDGVIITQVVPHFDDDLPIVGDYIEALRAVDGTAAPSFGSLEGYLATRIFIHGLETIQGPMTREAVIAALEGLGSFDIGLGQPLFLDAKDHQASHSVWPTIIKNGKIVPFAWKDLVSLVKRGSHD